MLDIRTRINGELRQFSNTGAVVAVPMLNRRPTGKQAGGALQLALTLVRACHESVDLQIWRAVVAAAPPGVVLKRGLELRKDRLVERQELRAAVQAAVRS
jgi:hypothetical protein